MNTFEQLISDPIGTIYESGTIQGIRYLVMRGPCSLCAYLGITKDHPLAGKDYNEINIAVHGGLTFSEWGSQQSSWPEGYWWIGWDYAHLYDRAFFDPCSGEMEWTPDLVMGDVRAAIPELVALVDYQI